MKKNHSLYAFPAIVVALCLTFRVEAQTSSASLLIPASSVSSKPMNVFSSIVNYDKMFPAPDHKSISGINISSSDAVKKNLSFFKSMKVYISEEDGSNEVLVAYENISKNASDKLILSLNKSASQQNSTIGSDRILPNSTIEDVISRLSGVQVIGNRISIRGISTTGNGSPIYVLDNVTMDNMPVIDPSIIKSIQVLKNASELAIYGMRGANGVILITTKKGEVAPQMKPGSLSNFHKESMVRVRVEYLLRDNITAGTGLNVSFLSASR